MRLKLIVNPISGTRSEQARTHLVDNIMAKLSSMGFDVSKVLTSCAGDATRLARQAIDEGLDGVLACGGDGTVNEVARAMAQSSVPMGILPNGSGNGLARHIGLPMDPLAAVDTINARHIEACDYATVGDIPFFCTFGVGFDADVAHRFASGANRGLFSYIKAAIQEFYNFKTRIYKITLDNETIEREALLIAVCNASQYGNNAYIAPQASITDGLLNVIIVKRAGRLRTAMLGVDLMSGLINDNSIIETHSVKSVRIERPENSAAHLDGEPMLPGTDLNITCHAGGLQLFTNPDKRPFKPLLTPLESLIDDLKSTFSSLTR